MSYGHVHRYLVRTVGSRGVISMAETLRLLTDYADGEWDSVQNLVKEINDMIRQFQQKIKITHDDINNEEALVFISMLDDDLSKAQNFFSPTELEFFRVLLEQIVTADSRQITSIHALNLVNSMNSSFTKTEAEKLLHKWGQMRYLDKDDNNYILGLRTIHEFEGYFRQNMPDAVEECCLCKTIVFRGYNCPACALAVHTRCLHRYVQKVQKWPCCKADYSEEQLENLRSDSSRLCQTQRLEATQRLSQANAEMQAAEDVTRDNERLEATQVLSLVATDNTHMQETEEDTQDIDLTQDIIPEISQRITRKRKEWL